MPATKEASADRVMTTIKTEGSQIFSGYLSKPGIEKGPGLLIIQEIFGINSHIRDVADLYAQDGFTVLAPDLFWRIKKGVELGYSDKDIQEGFGYAQRLDLKQTCEDLAEAVRHLKSLAGASTGVGCVGFCFGGLITYLLSATGAIDAGVSYYGGGIEGHLDKAENIKRPLLMHFADLDHFIPPATVEKIRTALGDNPQVHIYRYPGVDHGFNCDQRPSYNRQSAMLAYARSSAFLHNHLE